MSQLIAFRKIEFHINTMRVILDDENCFFQILLAISSGNKYRVQKLKTQSK